MRLLDCEDVMNKLVYTATNPIQDHLVERVHQSASVNDSFRTCVHFSSANEVSGRSRQIALDYGRLLISTHRLVWWRIAGKSKQRRH